jgi:hypothetical protein
MLDLFYLCGILFVLFNTLSFSKALQVLETNVVENLDKNKVKTIFIVCSFLILEGIWMLFGFLTPDWSLFFLLHLFLFMFLDGFKSKSIFLKKIAYSFFNLINTSVIIALVLNYFYLKRNILDIFLELFLFFS